MVLNIGGSGRGRKYPQQVELGQIYSGVLTAMSGIHRDDRPALIALGLILAALCFCVALTAYQPSAESDKKQPSSLTNAEGSAPAIAPDSQSIEQIQSTEYENPCGQGEDNRKSDLCAQWKAADAASYAALWGMISAIVGGLGVVSVAVSLYYTRQALLIAVAGTKAARKGNKIASRIGRSQTRAYLSCTSARYRLINQTCVLTFTVKNFGQSPANRCTLSAKVIAINIDSTGTDDQLLYSQSRETEIFFLPSQMEDDSATLIFPLQFSRSIIDSFNESHMLISAECKIVWDDVFIDSQTANFFVVESDTEIVDDGVFPRRRQGSMRVGNSRPDA
ncbi:MAG: hypothetical protein ABIQ45_08670 [Devosia sp.]